MKLMYLEVYCYTAIQLWRYVIWRYISIQLHFKWWALSGLQWEMLNWSSSSAVPICLSLMLGNQRMRPCSAFSVNSALKRAWRQRKPLGHSTTQVTWEIQGESRPFIGWIFCSAFLHIGIIHSLETEILIVWKNRYALRSLILSLSSSV